MFAAVTLALLVTAADPEPKLSEDAQKELKKFDGKWKVSKEITHNGENEPSDEIVLVFKGQSVTAQRGDFKFEMKISTLDPSTDPKCLDFKITKGAGPIAEGTVLEAIYKFDGETLTLAGYAGEDGKKRPANFEQPKEDGAGVWVMKKVKE